MPSTADRAPRLSLVLPTYNERPNLATVISRILVALDRLGEKFEIVVVDDDSPDRTWELAEGIAAGEPRVRVLRRVGQRGLASAVVAGWEHARGEVLGVMDADLQYPPETLPTLLEALERSGADIAICSRYAPGATVQQWSLLRWVISWGATGGQAPPAHGPPRHRRPGGGLFLGPPAGHRGYRPASARIQGAHRGAGAWPPRRRGRGRAPLRGSQGRSEQVSGPAGRRVPRASRRPGP